MSRHASSASSPARRGFTLIELLTVIAIISILMAVLIPTVGTVKRSARKAASTSNLNNIGRAMGLYANDNHGLMPAPTYGPSTTARNAVGSSNPKGASWEEELVPYLEGQLQQVEGSNAVTVTKWPDVLSCPEYVSINNGIGTDKEKRGYGMNIFPFRADTNPNSQQNNVPYPTQRQGVQNLPNHANNVVIGTSNDVTMSPGDDGMFAKADKEYVNGDPQRFGSAGLFLFLDDSVQALTPEEAAKILKIQVSESGSATTNGAGH